MESAIRVLEFGLEGLFIALLLGVVFAIFRSSSTLANNGNKSDVGVTNSVMNYQTDKYDGTTIYGADVKRLIEKYQIRNVSIEIKTARYDQYLVSNGLIAGKSFGNVRYSGGVESIDNTLLKDMYYDNSPTYIDDNWKFKSYVQYNHNEILCKIQFMQINE
jgi:hypothetical protein